VAQHARANRVNVSLVRFREELRLTIDDDGVGFDTVRVPSRASVLACTRYASASTPQKAR